MKIASIIGSNSHVIYIARLSEPDSDKETFGTFVSMAAGGETVAGVVCDSRLTNPDIARVSPRSEHEHALSDMRGDLLKDQKALIAILLLGSISNETAVHEVPRSVIPAGTAVEAMTAEAVTAFHRNERNEIKLHYLPNLIAQTGSLGVPLAKYMIGQLAANCGESERRRLDVMAQTLSWKHTFGEANF